MYASRIAEEADAEALFARPLHPYTQGLLRSLPKLGNKGERLPVIPGQVPDPLHFPNGCKFHPRCPIGNDDGRCTTVEPQLRQVEAGRCAACWYAPGYETKQEYDEYERKYGKHKRSTA
jgi:oligopeptide/dipeptide ABC transporter ATP-binding protein